MSEIIGDLTQRFNDMLALANNDPKAATGISLLDYQEARKNAVDYIDRICIDFFTSADFDKLQTKGKYYIFENGQGNEVSIEKKAILPVATLKAARLMEEFIKNLENHGHDQSNDFLGFIAIFSKKPFESTSIATSLNSLISKYKDFIAKEEKTSVASLTKLRLEAALEVEITGSETRRLTSDELKKVGKILLKNNILSYEDLQTAKYFDLLTVREIYDLQKEKPLGHISFLDLAGASRYMIEVAQVKGRIENSENPKTPEIRKEEKYLQHLLRMPGSAPLVTDLFIDQIISEKDFAEAVPKGKILSLEPDQIVALLLTDYGKSLNFDSNSLLELYGTSLDGYQFLQLAYGKAIKPEDLIKLLQYKSVNMVNPDAAIKPHDLLDFYTPEVLLDMYKRNALSPEFAKTFKELSDDIRFSSEQIEFTQNLLNYVKDNDEKYEDSLWNFKSLGIIETSDLSGYISLDKIEELIMEDKISRADILEFVKSGVIPQGSLKEYLTVDEIFESINDGTLESKHLLALPQEELAEQLQERYIEGTLSPSVIMDMYLKYDGISLDTLVDSFEMEKPKEDLTVFIEPGTDIQKIRKLFTHYIISYEDLCSMHDTGIIADDKDFEELKNSIDKAKFYEELRKTKIIYISSESESDEKTKSSKPSIPQSKKRAKTDFDLEKLALEDLFETPRFGTDPMPLINSYNTETNRPTSLNNYMVIPVEKYDLVIFEKFAAENTLFIMPYQQADYFLHGNMDLLETTPNSLTNPNNKNKKTLYNMQSVKAIPHTKHFFKHVIDAACKLSDTAREELKPRGRYSQDAKMYIESMQEAYIENSKNID